MKKISIVTLIIFLISLIQIAAAPPTPQPVTLTLEFNGEKVSFPDVTITNLATGEKLTKSEVPRLQMEKGICGFDLSEFSSIYGASRSYPGDTIEVKLCSLHPDCIFNFYADYTNPENFRFNIRISDEKVVIVPADPVEPIVVKDIVTKIICAETGEEVSNADECKPKEPEPIDESNPTKIALGILSAILAIACIILGKFKWGKGFVGLANYYKRKGDEAKKAGDVGTAKKHYTRAAKMVTTAITKAKDGTYK